MWPFLAWPRTTPFPSTPSIGYLRRAVERRFDPLEIDHIRVLAGGIGLARQPRADLRQSWGDGLSARAARARIIFLFFKLNNTLFLFSFKTSPRFLIRSFWAR